MYKETNVVNMSIEELDNLLQHFENILGSTQAVSMWLKAIISGINALEILGTTYGGMQINGITSLLKGDENFVDDCKHVILSNLTGAVSKPENGVLYKLVYSGLMMHNMKRFGVQLPPSNNNKNEEKKDINSINKNFSNL